MLPLRGNYIINIDNRLQNHYHETIIYLISFHNQNLNTVNQHKLINIQ